MNRRVLECLDGWTAQRQPQRSTWERDGGTGRYLRPPNRQLRRNGQVLRGVDATGAPRRMFFLRSDFRTVTAASVQTGGYATYHIPGIIFCGAATFFQFVCSCGLSTRFCCIRHTDMLCQDLCSAVRLSFAINVPSAPSSLVASSALLRTAMVS